MRFIYYAINRHAPVNNYDAYSRQLDRSEAARLMRGVSRCMRTMPGWVREYEILPGVSLQITLTTEVPS